ncbi:MAG: glycosyltransferase [Candidatus Levybacteria bacterium]|nr:glycosyltransferase [Candidatus Levybacteria bacterium]
MLKKPFFSVIIPTLNEEIYLPKLLSDFAKQRRKNFEIIIVDADSQDKTKEKALKFSKYFPLEFINGEKQNVSFQRNLGAESASGEFLLFLDADCRVNTMFTRNLYIDIFKRKGLLFLPVLITEERSRKNRVLFRLINSVIELSQSLTKPLSAGGSIFIAKKLFWQLNGFKENLYISEDHNLIQRARKLGVKAKILKDIKVVFSLRRVKKEGQVMVLYKYLLALVYMLVNGEVTSKIFMYEMGGGRYKDSKLKEKWSLKGDAAKLQKIIRKTSAFLVDSLS